MLRLDFITVIAQLEDRIVLCLGYKPGVQDPHYLELYVELFD